jgi:ABC-type glycerol-3-phosphate transport system substrate-binding protein
MPRYINFTWFHYNRQALDEAGVSCPDMAWTADDMAEAAAKLVQKDASGEVERFGGSFVEHEEPTKCLMGAALG